MFNPFQMLVIDQMHEFELGVFKAVLVHLVRILYIAGKTKKRQLVEIFDEWYVYMIDSCLRLVLSPCLSADSNLFQHLGLTPFENSPTMCLK